MSPRMRSPLRRLAGTSIILSVVLSASPAAAQPGRAVFSSATGAVLGGIVAGPIGLVAGAALGYVLGPTLTRVADAPVRRRYRRARRVAVAQPESQAFAQQPYMPQPGVPQQSMYMAQVPSPQQMPAYGQPAYPAQAPQPIMAGQVPSPQQQAYAVQGVPQGQAMGQAMAQPQAFAPSSSAAQRPPAYPAVPMPGALGPSGNYAAQAYKPQDDAQTPDPLH